jgi:hypothetical protein
MKKVTLIFASVVIMLVSFTSCNNSKQNKHETDKVKVTTKKNQKKLSGTYVCSEHWNDDLVGTLKMTFSDNNKVSFAGVTNTSYHIEGDSLFIDMSSYEMVFVIDGNTLKTSGPAGTVAYTK